MPPARRSSTATPTETVATSTESVNTSASTGPTIRIQPHGCLLVVDPVDWRILQCSSNTGDHLGRSPGELLGHDVRTLLPEAMEVPLLSDASPRITESPLPVGIDCALPDGRTVPFVGFAHRSDVGIVLELEAQPPGAGTPASRLFWDLQAFLDQLRQHARGGDAEVAGRMVLQETTREIARITGHDRVMAYRFDPDGWAGTVVAESLAESGRLTGFRGQRFSDAHIPEASRQIYRLNRAPAVPDTRFDAVDLIPPHPPSSTQALDTRFCVLGDIDPEHLAHLRSQGIGSSLSISLRAHGQLWGLLVAQSTGIRHVPALRRSYAHMAGRLAEDRIEVLDSSARTEP